MNLRRAIGIGVAVIFACTLTFPLWAGQVEDAETAFNKGDHATAVRLWLELAERGDAEAQYRLGVAYDEGRGIAKDDVEAARWYRRAAEQGHGSAQGNLGVMYRRGRGRERVEWRTVVWWR